MLFTIMSGKPMHSVLVGLVCLVIASSTCCASSVGSSNNTMCLESERNALLQFKKGLVDESNVLASWNNNKDCCEWRGITCNTQTGHVINLNLRRISYAENALGGTIDPSLLELQHLNYLDLSLNNFGGMIPKFIGSLSQLKELHLSDASFSGPIPPQLGNLSNLHTLDLYRNYVSFENLEWLSHLSSLRYLDMSWLDFSEVINWPQSLSKLTSLRELLLYGSHLPDVNLRSLSFINSSASLQVLELSANNLNSSVLYWVANVSSNLVYIGLQGNKLQGPISDVFTNILSLAYLDLSWNQLEGGLPKFFRNFSRLESLRLEMNQFSENIEDTVKTLSCAVNTLNHLDLSYNRFWGSWPDLTGFSKLRVLDFTRNQLNGSLPESVGQLSNLEDLSVRSNSLNGVITESHFSNLSLLQTLAISNNSFSINLSSDWNPPFQLDTLFMSSCKVDQAFPKWIQTQRNLVWLNMSNAGILGSLPNNFWDLFHGLQYLSLSMNQIHGKLPSLLSTSLRDVDLSSNQFSGALPSFPPTLTFLYLSDNMFSGSLSSLCATQALGLTILDLSLNQLSGEVPDCWKQFKSMHLLDLGKNNLSGKVPSSLGNLEELSYLRLYGNNFSGELPSFENCTQLVVVDLGANKLSGKIPTWIGESVTKLLVLRLRSNEFNGIIPFSLCNLSTIHVLDLSRNNISGALPHCIHNITALSDDDAYAYMYVELVWKGIEIEFGENIKHLRSIDISTNYLVGEIPESVTGMIKLNSLNLSRNKLTGKVPKNFGNLKMLESLDLSRNQISGTIPASFSSLYYLSVLDLSYNRLSGRIPLSTQLQSFDASKYMGNLGLCGQPLTRNCPGDGTTQDDGITRGNGASDNKEHDNDGLMSLGFLISTVLGFITGFWIVCGSLLLKSSWRYAYFKFLDDTKDWIYVKTAMYKAKMQRKIQR